MKTTDYLNTTFVQQIMQDQFPDQTIAVQDITLLDVDNSASIGSPYRHANRKHHWSFWPGSQLHAQWIAAKQENGHENQTSWSGNCEYAEYAFAIMWRRSSIVFTNSLSI
ncbi:hypothetical protein CS542_01285 [Pedobacter sp. IW39]|nr:hypothetical protein CS542_01285 [Pedobacter sp. IW39]